MAVGPRRQARATPIQSVREGHLSEGSAPEYPDFVERSRSDSEACARGRTALPDAHFEPAAQVRIRATSRSVVQGSPHDYRNRFATIVSSSAAASEPCRELGHDARWLEEVVGAVTPEPAFICSSVITGCRSQ